MFIEYNLRSVASCEDVDVILKRLDDKYADSGKVVNAIISKIRKFRYIDPRDSKRLIEFINIIECGYNDLKSLKLDKEICNANVVSLIENKLPSSLALDWYREMHRDSSVVDKSNKFPHILKFLLTEKRALEYAQSDVRVNRETKNGNVNEIPSYDAEDEPSKDDPSRSKLSKDKSNCLVHNTKSHVTSECHTYAKMPLNEKYNLLRTHFACYTYLEPKHLSVDCPSTRLCGIDNCNKNHHPSLHQQ